MYSNTFTSYVHAQGGSEHHLRMYNGHMFAIQSPYPERVMKNLVLRTLAFSFCTHTWRVSSSSREAALLYTAAGTETSLHASGSEGKGRLSD